MKSKEEKRKKVIYSVFYVGKECINLAVRYFAAMTVVLTNIEHGWFFNMRIDIPYQGFWAMYILGMFVTIGVRILHLKISDILHREHLN